MSKVISTIQLRRNTSENWASGNPILKSGEPGFEISASGTYSGKFKIGDGVTSWTSLPYVGGPSVAGVTQLVGLSDVSVTGVVADNEVLAYDNGSSKWTNQTLAEAGIQAAGSYAASSHTHVPADISSYTTSGTGATDNNKWTKFASIAIGAQFGDIESALQFVSYGDGSTTVGGAKIRIKVKQQTAFGTNPYVHIAVEHGANLAPANFYATIVQNTPSTTVDFYIQIPETYRAYRFYPLVTAGGTPTWFQAQPWLASVPAGVATVAAVADFGTVYGAFSGNVTGNLTGNVSGNVTGNVTGNSTTATTLYDADFKRITNPGGGAYTASPASVTGAIAVTLPVGATNTMVKMTIKVYEWVTNESFDVVCGGYVYSTGNTWANAPFAYIVGNPSVDRRLTVRFGYTAGGKMVVYIGELASTWSYPQIFVTDVQLGYTGQAVTWTTGWSIGFQSSAFENVTATITNSQIGYQASTNTANSVVLRDGSGNFSAGAISATSVAVSAPGTATSTVRNITVSTAAPSGGIDGDVWMVYA